MSESLAALILEVRQGIYAIGNLMFTGEIEYLICHPQRGRQGATASLLDALEDVARVKGLPSLYARSSLLAKISPSSRDLWYKLRKKNSA